MVEAFIGDEILKNWECNYGENNSKKGSGGINSNFSKVAPLVKEGLPSHVRGEVFKNKKREIKR